MLLAAVMAVLGGTASVWAGIADEVREPLQHGGDPNAWVKQDFGFRTHPLHLVAAAGGEEADRLEAVRFLIDAVADVNGRDDSGNTPLHKAIGALNPKVAELLIGHGAKANARNKAGETPIFRLASSASYLHYRNPSKNERKTMLRDMRTLVDLLSRHGADLDAINEKGETPLAHLASIAPAEILGALPDLGAWVDAADKKGERAIDKAVSSNDAGAVRQLVAHGARASASRIVHAIEQRQDAKMVLAMVEGGASAGRGKSILSSPTAGLRSKWASSPDVGRAWVRVPGKPIQGCKG